MQIYTYSCGKWSSQQHVFIDILYSKLSIKNPASSLFCTNIVLRAHKRLCSQVFPGVPIIFIFFFFSSEPTHKAEKNCPEISPLLYIYKVVVHRHFQCKQASSLSKLGKGRHIYMYAWPCPLIYFMGMKHYGFPVDVLIEGVNHCKCTFYGFSIQTWKTLKSHNYNSRA